MTYRVIGPDGVERNISPTVSDWVTAVRSGHADGDCLFWDSRAQRWSCVSTLEVYNEARNEAPVSREPTSLLKSEVSAGPANASKAHPAQALSASHHAVGDESTTDPSSGRRGTRRRPTRRSVSALLGVAALIV